MRILGQLCLLSAFVAFGYAGFAQITGSLRNHRLLLRSGTMAAVLAYIALCTTMSVLGWALITKNFEFEYVVHYSSTLLPWHYSLSALWVGQAGSLLLWCWLLASLSIVFRFCTSALDSRLREVAFGILLVCVEFLIAIMVFAADPMRANIVRRFDGSGLNPLLQHPSMLIHPPVVFAGYSLWAIPFAVSVAALITGRLDTSWTRIARPWALWAWIVLGAGILLGAHWAYQELGWGGYWGWDPVENGSLVPWLTGTALIHGLMSWRYRGNLKKTTIALSITTFALCNFATFLTRSGIFSSVHAFSESPIGWMFLVFMVVLALGGVVLIIKRWHELAPQHSAKSFISRETFIVLSSVMLIAMTLVILTGTLVTPFSKILIGRTVQLGPAFYNNVLTPVGLVLLALTAAVPLIRWGSGPTTAQRRALLVCFVIGCFASVFAFLQGVHHVIYLCVVGMACSAVCAVITAFGMDVVRRTHNGPYLRAAARALLEGRRQYAGYLVHMGFVCLVIGITGSSLGTQRREAVMQEGEVIQWAGRQIRYIELSQSELADKLVAEVELEVTDRTGRVVTLRPSRHLHLLQDQWTTEVAIDSTWEADFYTVLHAGLGGGEVVLTFVFNPMMRWLWIGGILSASSAIIAVWPANRNRNSAQSNERLSWPYETSPPQPTTKHIHTKKAA